MRNKILISCLVVLSSCCLNVCQKKRTCDNHNTSPYIKIKFTGFSKEELATCQVIAHETKSKKVIQTQNFRDSLIAIASGEAWDLKSNYYIIKTALSYDSVHDISFELFKEKSACDGNCKTEVEKFRNLSFHRNGTLIMGDTMVVKR